MNPQRSSRSWPWFLAWAGVGAGAVTALLTILTIGLYVGALTLVGLVMLGRLQRSQRGTPGLIAGAGLMPLWIGWLNRGGPGNVCDAHSCTEEWSPWPWLAVGVVLVVAGTVIWARWGRHSPTGPSQR
ncbi:hypothetical protein ABIA32_001582 [Streptacidiphilus sp. MAP12-20]|uniref:hypothetical protein n=1 Tax=Streptacidiphilus sp. MAP12-20 TaxID=3156299 RepID=UPI0035162F80